MRTYAETSRMRGRRQSRGRARSIFSRLFAMLVIAWLTTGILAGAQRDYYQVSQVEQVDCVGAETIAVTILAGPLNYLGLNPKIGECDLELPQPSP